MVTEELINGGVRSDSGDFQADIVVVIIVIYVTADGTLAFSNGDNRYAEVDRAGQQIATVRIVRMMLYVKMEGTRLTFIVVVWG